MERKKGDKEKGSQENVLRQLLSGESYTNLILGILVVVIAGVLFVSFGRKSDSKNVIGPSKDIMSQKTQEPKQVKIQEYTVVEGDHLWGIAERKFKSGYNWVDIAKENNLSSPDVLSVGLKLKIPNVKPKELTILQTLPTQTIEKITSSSYKVIEGDNLWNIAVRAYGDGYRWVDIARLNNLAQPDLIHAGNVLKLPR